MAISAELREEIKQQLISTIKRKVDTYDFSKRSGNPFIDVIFGNFSNLKSFIHSVATTFGSTYENIAQKIAQNNPGFVEAKKMVFTGRISDAESAVIKNTVKKLEEDKTGSNYDREVEAIYAANEKGIKETRITIDLYLKDVEGKEFFIEMKGPDPNKKEVRAAKEDLLNVVAMKKREITKEEFNNKASIIFGVYYNNTKGGYNNWKVSPIFEKGNGLFVQEEFWDFLGGAGTFDDLLEIISEVGEEVKELINKTIEKI